MVAQQQASIVGENNEVVVVSTKNFEEQSTTMMMMIKGKRTKRPRPLSPLALTMSSATTTDEGGATSAASEEWTAPHSAATSEEEENMAHCLILLAQGSNQSRNINNNNNHTNTKGSNGIMSYECKTCNKSFSSFQALGGHRASHKKPKPNVVALTELKKSSTLDFSLINNDKDSKHHGLKQYDQHYNNDGAILTLHIANSSSICTRTNNANKAKVHDCGICGAEFSSGQALGGHMRRHRPIGMTTSTTTIPIPTQSVTIAVNGTPNNVLKDENMTRNILSLDLNLPAPEDELRHQHQPQHQQRDSSSKFVFSANEKTLVFTAASQLVDCHY